MLYDDTEKRDNTDRPSHTEHLGKHRQYWRDIILGCNDGLISTFLLVTGVVGGGMSNNGTLLTAISGSVAGAVSMFAGEFIATKAQDEVMQGEKKLEENHIVMYRDDELNELTDLLKVIGIPPSSRKSYSDISDDRITDMDEEDSTETKLHEMLLDYYKGNPNALLKIMIALEFGVIDGERRNPLMAGLTSMFLFFIGSLPSIIPFALSERTQDGLFAASIGTSVGLFSVGVAKSLATRGSLLRAGFENLLIAGMGAVAAYSVGVVFDTVFSTNDDE